VSDVSRFSAAAAHFATSLVAVGLTMQIFPVEAQTQPSAPMPRDATANAGLVLKPAPDFSRSDLAGTAIRLKNYRGKVVLLNFWATWCGPCLAEIPRFSGWQRQYGPEGLQILGVSMDDDSPPVKRAVRKYKITYPVLMGDQYLGELYGGVFGLPLSYIIDPSGHIIGRYQGEADLTQMEFRIRQLLPNPRR
jgi:cytochrome c biogenesis protein CcmG/thiol:disulfide interchange protein DsbE